MNGTLMLPHTYDQAPPPPGNAPLLCTCGEPKVSPVHPHVGIGRKRQDLRHLCVCGKPMNWKGHL